MVKSSVTPVPVAIARENRFLVHSKVLTNGRRAVLVLGVCPSECLNNKNKSLACHWLLVTPHTPQWLAEWLLVPAQTGILESLRQVS